MTVEVSTITVVIEVTSAAAVVPTWPQARKREVGAANYDILLEARPTKRMEKRRYHSNKAKHCLLNLVLRDAIVASEMDDLLSLFSLLYIIYKS